jgi:hypothetical protein
MRRRLSLQGSEKFLCPKADRFSITLELSFGTRDRRNYGDDARSFTVVNASVLWIEAGWQEPVLLPSAMYSWYRLPSPRVRAELRVGFDKHKHLRSSKQTDDI